jgi:hypothetical protein
MGGRGGGFNFFWLKSDSRARVSFMSENMQNPDFVMNPGEKTTMLFMQMVFQLSSLTTMMLGKVPHPETGETKLDLEAAQLMIDQLDMLETKTKGNLTHDEAQLLKQTLMSLRMAYVEAVDQPASSESKEEEKPASTEAKASKTEEAEADPADDSESKKRFTKKY